MTGLWNNSLTGLLPASLGRSSPLQWGVAWPELAPAMGGRVVELLHGPVPAGIICDGKELVKGRAHQGGGARRAAVLDRGEEERERERRRR
jgi:hypothetical protein